jgi:hypothetical protein
MNTLAVDAYVNDDRREIWGADAIRKLIDSEFVQFKVTMDIRQIIDHYGDIIVTAKYDGTYDSTKPARRSRDVQLLLDPRRRDRRPQHHLEPAFPLLTDSPGTRGQREHPPASRRAQRNSSTAGLSGQPRRRGS